MTVSEAMKLDLTVLEQWLAKYKDEQPFIEVRYHWEHGWSCLLRYCPPPLRGWVGSDGEGATMGAAIHNALHGRSKNAGPVEE